MDCPMSWFMPSARIVQAIFGSAPKAAYTDMMADIAESLAQASGKPVKAYVVQQDVATQTAFARRTNNAATF